MTNPGKTRLSKAIEVYLQRCSLRLSTNTVRSYRMTLERLLAHTGDLYCESLRPHHFEEFLSSLLVQHTDANGILRAPVQAKSFNGYLARVQPFARWLLSRGMTKTDLLADCQRHREPKKIRLRLEPEQVWDLLDAATSPRDRVLVALAVQTAMRASEIRTLRVGDLDMDRRTLRVYVHKSQQEDLLPLTPMLHAELEQWLATYSLDVGKRHDRMLADDDYLIPAMLHRTYAVGFEVREGRRQRKMTPPGYDPARPLAKAHENIRRLLNRIGLEDHGEGVHTLRRTSARLFFDRLVDEKGYDSALRTVSALLHHASSATTEHYLGLTSERRTRDALLATDGLLPPRQTSAKVIPLPGR